MEKMVEHLKNTQYDTASMINNDIFTKSKKAYSRFHNNMTLSISIIEEMEKLLKMDCENKEKIYIDSLRQTMTHVRRYPVHMASSLPLLSIGTKSVTTKHFRN